MLPHRKTLDVARMLLTKSLELFDGDSLLKADSWLAAKSVSKLIESFERLPHDDASLQDDH